MSYSHIENLDEFWEKLWQKAKERLADIEPAFIKRYTTCIELSLPIDQCYAQSVPLLTGKFDTFISLMESLHEVRYYWKRLSEAARLFEASHMMKTNPVATQPQISENEWFMYHYEYWWHTSFGLLERIIRFFKCLDRHLKLPQNSDVRVFLRDTSSIALQYRNSIASLRHPMAHRSSIGMDNLKQDHIWEIELATHDSLDTLTLYENAFMTHRNDYQEHVAEQTAKIRDIVLVGTFRVLLAKEPFDKID